MNSKLTQVTRVNNALIAKLMVAPLDWGDSLGVEHRPYRMVRFFSHEVVHQGMAYPLVGTMLRQKGNSNTDEPLDLIAQFRAVFPNAEIVALGDDTESFAKKLKLDTPEHHARSFCKRCTIFIWN